MEVGRVLINEEEIAARLRELGERITRDYRGEELLMVGVLKGGFITLADLARYVRLPVRFDFIATSSYGDGTASSGVVRILKDLDEEISGRHVLIVEDIVDTGLTLDYLLKMLRVRQPASLELAAFLLKEGMQQKPIDVRYLAFAIGPEFVIGYGLDYAQQYRHLPYVGVMEE